MTIKTKFALQQEVFFMAHNRVSSSKISEIKVKARSYFLPPREEITVTYELSGHGSNDFKEKDLFASKKDLLKSL